MRKPAERGFGLETGGADRGRLAGGDCTWMLYSFLFVRRVDEGEFVRVHRLPVTRALADDAWQLAAEINAKVDARLAMLLEGMSAFS